MAVTGALAAPVQNPAYRRPVPHSETRDHHRPRQGTDQASGMAEATADARRARARSSSLAGDQDRTRMQLLSGSSTTASGAAERTEARSAPVSDMLLPSETAPTRRAAPMP